MDDLIPRIDRLESRVNKLESITSGLREDLAEVRAMLPSLSTKEDLRAIETSLTKELYVAINGILGDAIRAYPNKLGVIWTAIGSTATLVATALALILWLRHGT